MSDRSILIAGGGIGGLTAALCLARQGFAVTLFEQAEDFAEVGAGIQLSPNCTRVLHYLGLEDALRSSAFVPQGTQFRHWRGGQVITETALGEAARSRYGMPYYHIHRGDLLSVLVAAAQADPAIEMLTGARVEAFEQGAQDVTVQLAGGSRKGCALVGADGIHSMVRAALWGEQRPQFTGNVAWRALVPAAALPTGRIRPVTSVWWGPHQHFVHYFVRRGELINCVCVVEKAGWEIESWTEPGAHDELQADFAGWHADLQLLIEHMDKTSLYKWALFDRPPMPAWGRGRVTLLGDACHPTLPFMAQGAAMAIEDGAMLARCLAEQPDEPLALGRYETLRRARTARVQLGSRRNATVFHLTGLKAWLRNRAAATASHRSMDSLYSYDVFEAH